ncbi:MAG: hypothetical protein ACYTFK_11960 [Planctomycetota bacterium]|jgi:hypothetical protein
MDKFQQSLQSERARLISKIRMTVRLATSGKADTIGCRDADAVLQVILADLNKHSDWLMRNEPEA